MKLCNIERFATHDGEGIRTVLFFQGCPLHCPWCANPESQSVNIQLLHDIRKCTLCHTCEQHCPQHAIHFDNNTFHFNQDQCIACQRCEQQCYSSAIKFASKDISIEKAMEEIRKDKDYYITSNGGVTISGGEPFVQFDALLQLLIQLKKESYHITIETCGQYPLAHLKEAYPYIDTFYFDIKHLDPVIYQQTVGGNLEQVQENMNYIISKDPQKIIFRVPVIPNFNNDKSLLEAILDMAAHYHVKEVHFLPYHTLGSIKYEQLQRTYAWSEEMMKEEDLYPYLDIAKQKGVLLKIGG